MLDRRAPQNEGRRASDKFEQTGAEVASLDTDPVERLPAHQTDIRRRPFVKSAFLYKLIVTLFDSLIAALAMLGAVRWRYDFLNRPIPDNVEEVAALITFFVCLVVWPLMGVPRAIWRYTSLDDIGKLAQAVFVIMALVPLTMYLFVNSGAGFPRSAPFIAGPVCLLMLIASRLLLLIFRNGDIRAVFNKTRKGRSNAVLVGSGEALYTMLRDTGRSAGGPNMNIIGLVTTDDQLPGRSIRGFPIVGTQQSLRDVYRGLVKKYDEPPNLIAIDANPKREKAAELVRIAAELNAPLSRMMPGQLGELTPFEAQDLIGRKQRSLDIGPVQRMIEGRRVLITGAGGSIGSELVRQVLPHLPSHLTLIDQSEFNLYTIDRQVAERVEQSFEWDAYLGDVTDKVRMTEIIEKTRPDVVLHAAALKHVPLGENNPLETLYTNVEGTRVLLDLCVRYKVPSFTLVSTDKAVNVVNVMGASKALAEMLTHAYDQSHEGLAACAVRFGNVLASAGSVIPLFDEQIRRGGPVTVTDPAATRYFMTTHEASALVLQATALNAAQRKSDSSIYVLEMGEPVNISHLARQLIRLRGKVPGEDVDIVYTGLRPGESLDERILGEPEALETTYVDGLLRISGTDYDPDTVPPQVETLIKAVQKRNITTVRKALKKLLPAYHPNGSLH